MVRAGLRVIVFRSLHQALGVACLVQASGDLGERMHTAFRLHAEAGPVLLIGTDCPPLAPQHLRDAAQALLDGHEAVLFLPAGNGGYVLVGLRSPRRLRSSTCAGAHPR